MAQNSSALEEAFANDSGAGFEEVTEHDVQFARLGIIHAGSPQLKK